MFFIAFLLAFFFVDGQSNERIYPSNTAVVSGKQFSLVCENYSGGITTTWKFLRVGTYADRVIYNGTHILDEFRSFQVHSTADGLSNLTKPIASMDDAGKYKCIHKHGSDYDVNSAEVIVFATDPVCSPKETNVMEGQFLEINCSGHYIGSISPIMKWTMGDGIDSNFDAIIANVSSIFFVISSLKMNATRIYNKVTFQCTTYFNQPIISNESQTSVRKAINAPTYEHQSTHRLNVLYEPDAVEIIPIKEVYTLGDVLLCSANGNPTPTYEWTELGSNRVVSRESYLTVDSIAMENHAYKCTATYHANGKEASISTTVTIPALARLWRSRAPQPDVTAELGNSDQHLSTYESIDNIGTQVHNVSVDLQADRPSLSERQENPTDFNITAERPEKNHTPPTDQHVISLQDRTCYAPLGDRTSPPSTIYERLNPHGPAVKEAISHPSEYTSHKTSSITRDVEIYQNPDQGPYVNVNQISLGRKVREY